MRVFTRFLFVGFAANFEFAGFRKQIKYTAYDRFHGNDPYGEIPTKKEPIRTLGFASSLSCHIIKNFNTLKLVYYKYAQTTSPKK